VKIEAPFFSSFFFPFRPKSAGPKPDLAFYQSSVTCAFTLRLAAGMWLAFPVSERGSNGA
jgi:hypothetical protein